MIPGPTGAELSRRAAQSRKDKAASSAAKPGGKKTRRRGATPRITKEVELSKTHWRPPEAKNSEGENTAQSLRCTVAVAGSSLASVNLPGFEWRLEGVKVVFIKPLSIKAASWVATTTLGVTAKPTLAVALEAGARRTTGTHAGGDVTVSLPFRAGDGRTEVDDVLYAHTFVEVVAESAAWALVSKTIGVYSYGVAKPVV